MNAADALAASEAAKDAAEAALQARVAEYRARATPEALLEAELRGFADAAGARARLDLEIAAQVARGEREVRGFSVHNGQRFSRLDPLGVTYMTALTRRLRRYLDEDGFTVSCELSDYVTCGATPGARPRTFEYLIGAWAEVRW